jgi:hypothetical protein
MGGAANGIFTRVSGDPRRELIDAPRQIFDTFLTNAIFVEHAVGVFAIQRICQQYVRQL